MMFQHDNYDDIIDLPHPTSKVHPRMTMMERAAQFSPFAALTGHGDAIEETARIVDEKFELDEDQKTIINRKLNEILVNLSEHPQVSIIYFQQDTKKTGGAYISIHDRIKKYDEYKHLLILEQGVSVQLEDIYDINEVE